MYEGIFNLAGKVVLITGGAGHLGSEISRALSDFGANVIIVSRGNSRPDELVHHQSAHSEGRISFQTCDVTDSTAFADCVSEILKATGKIDVLINHAASEKRFPIAQIGSGELETGFKNLMSHYFTCSKEVHLQCMKKQGGVIINTASIWSFIVPNPAVYLDLGNDPSVVSTMAKGGVLQLTRHLASYWAKDAIRVNAVCAGFFPKKRGEPRPDYMSEINRRVPLGRIGQPKEIAGLYVYLSSDASSYVTGQGYVIDGGYSIW